MVRNNNIDAVEINIIVKKIIDQINLSREQILNILESVRNENQGLKEELVRTRQEIETVINEVDSLEKQDKVMRQKLVEVSKKFSGTNEQALKETYEKASEIRIRYITRTNDEKALKEKRYSLEIAFKRSMANIENAEKVINQISVAMGYLEGDIMALLEGADRNSEMFVGIKILEAQENERKRIARDIHDGPAQYMANAVIKSDVSMKLIQSNLDEGLKELAGLKGTVRTALKEVRDIIYNLRPIALEDLGLNQTIEEMANSIMKESGIEVNLRLKPVTENVESIIQVAVYRLVQEILNNIRKHAKATRVEIKLNFGTKYLVLSISDNGIGFNVEEIMKRVREKGTSYGLTGIFDRVSQLQGDVKISSAERAGTTYNIKLPINREVIKDDKG